MSIDKKSPPLPTGCSFDRRQTLLMAAGLAGGSILAGATPEAFAQGWRGGTLITMITPEPPIAVPAVNNQATTLIVASKVFEGLLSYSPKLEPLPQLASGFSVSPDSLTYIFKIRENVFWHDGKPFTADDVVFNVSKLHPELNPRLRGTLANIERCAATDPSTVEIKLKQAFEPFLLNFDATTLPMLPRHVYEGTDYRQNPANQSPVGTGPFRFAEWQRGNFLRFVRNERYWQEGKPALDTIIYRVIPDSNLRSAALQSGQVQLAGFADIEAFDVPRFQAQDNLAVSNAGWELYSPISWIELNHRVKPLDDKRVRRALSMAIDRNFIVQRLWFGVGRPATSPIPSTTRYFDPSVRLPAFDVAAANRLLDEAGHPRGPGGTRFEMKFMPMPYSEIWNRLAEYVRQAFAQVGVRLIIEPVDSATWARRIGDWDYQIATNFVYTWGDPTIGVERTYVTSNIQKIVFTNTAGYSNPEVDAAFAFARRSINPEERREAFARIQRLLVEDMPLIWLMELSFPTLHDKRLRNVITTATGIHSNFADVATG